jgi:glycosyltransferase involved in cell wall biosynthesis
MNSSPDRPIRVLLVAGPAAGGLKRHVERLAACLPTRGVELAVAAPAGSAYGAVPAFPFELGDRPRPALDLHALQQLRRAAARWQPDLIHAHGVKAAIICLLAFPHRRPHVVVTYHNRWLGGPLTLPLRLLAPRAHASIAVSEAVRASLSDHGIQPAGLRVIRNGIDPELFSPREGARREQPFTYLFLGRLTEEKGIPLLLEAARGLEGRVDLRIEVAGDGPLRTEVESAASRMGSVLAYLGHQAEVLPLFQHADAVLMPSLSEGLPMTALEGMACGLPLLTSAVGGIPELVLDGVTGVLMEGRDAAAWSQAMLRLASDPQRAVALGKAGRRRVETEFSEAVMLQQLLETYREALD